MGLGVGSGYTWVTTELLSRENRNDLRREVHESPWERWGANTGWRMSSGFEKRCGQVRKELRGA